MSMKTRFESPVSLRIHFFNPDATISRSGHLSFRLPSRAKGEIVDYTPEQYRGLKRKIDRYLLPLMCVLQSALHT